MVCPPSEPHINWSSVTNLVADFVITALHFACIARQASLSALALALLYLSNVSP
jgi:hypothetical protein